MAGLMVYLAMYLLLKVSGLVHQLAYEEEDTCHMRRRTHVI